MAPRIQVVQVGVQGPTGPGLGTHEGASNTFMHVVQCTSTTRPSAPIEGQPIYETDTDIFKVYSGSAWVDIRALTKAPAARAYLSADQSGIVPSTDTLLTFGTETFDTHGIHAAGVFTVPTGYAGKWLAVGQVNYDAGTSGDYRDCIIYHNVTASARNRTPNLATNDPYVQAQSIIQAAAGDTISFYARHDASGNRSAQGGSANETWGAVYYLGA